MEWQLPKTIYVRFRLYTTEGGRIQTEHDKDSFLCKGQNLLTITGYSGLDPETNSRLGVDWNGMPQQRSFTFGANITF